MGRNGGRSVNPFDVFLFFLKISSVTFGGGIAILGMVRLEMRQRGVLSDDEVEEVCNFAVVMPGPIAVSAAYMLGRRLAGIRGALCGILGAALPPFLIILLLSPFFLRHFNDPFVKKFFAGVLAAVAAMIVAMVVRDVRRTLLFWPPNFVAYAAVIAMIVWLGMHPLLALLAGFVLQVAVFAAAGELTKDKTREKEKRGKEK